MSPKKVKRKKREREFLFQAWGKQEPCQRCGEMCTAITFKSPEGHEEKILLDPKTKRCFKGQLPLALPHECG